MEHVEEDVTTATELRLHQLAEERYIVSKPIAIEASAELQRRHDRYVGRYDNQAERITALEAEIATLRWGK